MKIIENTELTRFEFWMGAKANAEMLTEKELEIVDEMIDELWPEGICSVALNDLFWFDFSYVVEEMLGYEYDEENGVIVRNNGEE